RALWTRTNMRRCTTCGCRIGTRISWGVRIGGSVYGHIIPMVTARHNQDHAGHSRGRQTAIICLIQLQQVAHTLYWVGVFVQLELSRRILKGQRLTRTEVSWEGLM